ncbi:ATP-binding protein [Enterobacter roggenkampii]|uniref:ATP-binding protein n=1 Tax=Enterobacter roggenkampii TaxID=1812935 RepID=UPI00084C23BE|nr:AAA family ATPase [Enterobacter roggenkampii]AOP98030.1 hypothetical protein BFV67_22930 [Enterobacter roggenkampii]QWZ75371.1 AAA family ATPase [Enterobacter roggenkampii]
MDTSVTSFPIAVQEYADNHCYHILLKELARIDLCLQRYASQHREALESHVLTGFLLDDEEIRTCENQSPDKPHWMKETEARHVNKFFQETGSGDRLSLLIERFELTPFEADLLILGLLPHIDSRYFSLFAALQRRGQKSLPTFEFALEVLGKTSLRDADARLSLLPQSPLIKNQLITTEKSGERQGESWIQSLYQTATGVYQYLTGNRYSSPELERCTEWYPQDSCQALYTRPEVFTAIQVQGQASGDGIYPVLMLEGAIGSGRLGAIRGAASRLGYPVLYMDIKKLPNDPVRAHTTLREALREVRMHEAVFVIRHAEFEGEMQSISIHLAMHLPQPGMRIVVLCERQMGNIALPGVPQLIVPVTGLLRSEKEKLLVQLLDGEFCAEIDTSEFCRRFSFTPTTLPLILQEAKSYRALRNTADIVRTVDLNKAFRLHARKDFGKLAQRKEPKRTFDDLVASDELKIQLTEILIAAKHRDAVLEMGFASKVGYGTGVSALFCGHSGTGKTMAAEVIAGQLGVDLIKVDLSTVVNKYVGETEKNLSRIFDLAEADAGVLFFDEADALFGKRTAVSDSKDRHANIEVAYLLQRLENYPGLVILATNNRNHLDDAFTRRFTFITRFNFPDAELREEMWLRIWPKELNISEDIDFAMLARNYELTGANIRNIALMSAWKAKDEGVSGITGEHINLALRRELEKTGRLSIAI